MCVFFKELNTGNAADDADEMPEVQETVTMIPGSTLLWRITPRPAHSDQVTSLDFFSSACAEMFKFYYLQKRHSVSKKYSWRLYNFALIYIWSTILVDPDFSICVHLNAKAIVYENIWVVIHTVSLIRNLFWISLAKIKLPVFLSSTSLSRCIISPPLPWCSMNCLLEWRES